MIAFISIPFSGLTGFTGALWFWWFGLVCWVGLSPFFSPKIPKKIITIINTMTKQKSLSNVAY